MAAPAGAVAGGRDGPILLVGCGRMGSALLSGWLDQGIAASRIVVVETDDVARQRAAGRCALAVAEASALPADLRAAVVVLAVKPQVMAAVAPAFAPFAAAGALILSIAAGRTLASLAGWLGAEAALVRAMPNTPAAIRRGITVCCANGAVDGAGRAVSEHLLGTVGEVLWVDDEALMDPVTALSGSGPAYVFLLAEAMAAAGTAAGLPAHLSARLARATVVGAGALLEASTDAPEALRHQVTSPGGTTAAALDVLMADGGLKDLMVRAVIAAAARSRDLARS